MRSAWLWTALLLVAVAGGSYGVYAYLRPAPLAEQVLYGSGHVEVTEVKVAAEIGGRVLESKVMEGKTVARGSVLVRIDDKDLQLRKARAEAEIEALGKERDRTERELDVARHHRRTAETNVARYRELRERGTASPQQLEQAEDAFQSARGRAAALEAAIGALDAKIAAARREIDLLQHQIEKSVVRSPIDGTILTKAIEAGEVVQSGQGIAILADLSRVEVKIYIPERDLGKLSIGAHARIRVDAFPDRVFEARVSRVDQQAQFTPRAIHMPEERVRMVFGVTLAANNPQGILKPGMPVDAWILWRNEAGWPKELFVPR